MNCTMEHQNSTAAHRKAPQHHALGQIRITAPSKSYSKSVAFAAPLVTSVAYRPRISAHNKRFLFYSRAEIERFRIENRRESSSQHNGNGVTFADDVVSEIYEVPSLKSLSPKEQSELYYSADDLQRFMESYLEMLSLGMDDDDFDSDVDPLEASRQTQVEYREANATELSKHECYSDCFWDEQYCMPTNNASSLSCRTTESNPNMMTVVSCMERSSSSNGQPKRIASAA